MSPAEAMLEALDRLGPSGNGFPIAAVLQPGWFDVITSTLAERGYQIVGLGPMPTCTDDDCPIYARHRAKGQVFPPHGPHDFRAATTTEEN